MSSIQLQARAKINLSLDVVGKRPDGYHDVKMIMQTINLYDTVIIEPGSEGIEIDCNCQWVPSDNQNIAYKAANLILSKYDVKLGARIKIIKNIPVSAGLAGGSTDAAAVLKGINHLFSLGIKEDELMFLGKQIGADVPYCIKGGTMLAEGIGEVLTPLSPLIKLHIVLVKPKIGVSTAWVYKKLDLDKITSRPDTELLIKAIEDGNAEILAKSMRNVLETVTIRKYRVIREIKDKLVKYGAMGSMMSGSGPSVFGIFKDRHRAEYAYRMMKNGRWDCFLTETICEER